MNRLLAAIHWRQALESCVKLLAFGVFASGKAPIAAPLPAPAPPLDLLDRCAEEYLSVKLAEGVNPQRIVDKMPENYHWLGAIACFFQQPKLFIFRGIR
ncbi:MAG: hypothetical protein R3E67_05400 [Pseudomonadales bacterium]